MRLNDDDHLVFEPWSAILFVERQFWIPQACMHAQAVKGRTPEEFFAIAAVCVHKL